MKPCQFRVWEGIIIPLLKCTRNAIGVGRMLSCHIYFVKEGVMLTIPLLKSIPYLLILATSLTESFGVFETTCIFNEEQQRKCDIPAPPPNEVWLALV